jgi:hypothetical protein
MTNTTNHPTSPTTSPEHNTVAGTGTPVRRWPLWLLAAPAAVSIWAGWVRLGQMCGFDVVHPLPGIADEFTLNTAITLPIGMEAYAAYALGAWLSPRQLRPAARAFAKRSALASLGLGLLGQAIYHLLETLGHPKAPWPVVLFVACLPVLVLGAGATLHHLLSTHGTDTAEGMAESVTAEAEVLPATAPAAIPAAAGSPASAASTPRWPAARRGQRPRRRRLRADFLAEAREKLAAEPTGFVPSPAWCRQVTGCSQRLSGELAKTLRAERRATGANTGTGTGTEARTEAGMEVGTSAGTDELENAA